MPEYKVQLDAYNGPLDLLLYLIRRDEVDIYDIPIARLTEQYCRFCETLRRIDPDMAGEFLVMAATLMEIKSRTLLPRAPVDADEDGDMADPRLELVRQLLEYKRIKDASVELAKQAEQHAQRFPRGVPAKEASAPGDIDLSEVQLWDLVAAFGQLLAATGKGPVTHDVIFDDTPISLHATDIVDRLSREGSLSLQQVFEGRTRGEMIGLFLALLELVRETRVKATQSEVFGQIQLVLLSVEPIALGDEWDRKPAGDTVPAGADEPPESNPDRAPLRLVTEEDDEDTDRFDELDSIRVDMDIDLGGSEPGISQERDTR